MALHVSKKHYDFVIIECLHQMILHYNVDVRNLAEILHIAGYKVVVVNYLSNNTYHQNRIYEVININSKSLLSEKKEVSNSIGNVIHEVVLDINRYKYFKTIFNLINKEVSYDNMYIGSLREELIPLLFLNNIEAKSIFAWGLRAHFLKIHDYSIKKIRVNIRKYILQKMCRKAQIHFIVSNNTIKDEFNNLRFPKDRIIVRPERTISKITYYPNLIEETKLLSIGSLRKDKNIPFIIDGVKDLYEIKYIIAGKSDKLTKKSVDEYLKSQKINNITRLSGYISDLEYQELFKTASFLVLADEPEQSAKTNGTLIEAVFNSLPIIAPDFEPYRSIVNHYKIGVLYDSGNHNDFKNAIIKAQRYKKEYFKWGILEFQKDHLLNTVTLQTKEQLLKIGISPKKSQNS